MVNDYGKPVNEVTAAEMGYSNCAGFSDGGARGTFIHPLVLQSALDFP